MSLFKRTKESSDETRCCTLCEFVKLEGDEYTCNGKPVSAMHICKRFIFDPQKLYQKKQTLKDREFELADID